MVGGVLMWGRREGWEVGCRFLVYHKFDQMSWEGTCLSKIFPSSLILPVRKQRPWEVEGFASGPQLITGKRAHQNLGFLSASPVLRPACLFMANLPELQASFDTAAPEFKVRCASRSAKHFTDGTNPHHHQHRPALIMSPLAQKHLIWPMFHSLAPWFILHTSSDSWKFNSDHFTYLLQIKLFPITLRGNKNKTSSYHSLQCLALWKPWLPPWACQLPKLKFSNFACL